MEEPISDKSVFDKYLVKNIAQKMSEPKFTLKQLI